MSDSKLNLPNLYALVIGINKYKSRIYPDLEGCVSDATSIVGYLKNTLNVPQDNIRTLFDEEATRKGILDMFRKHLIHNQKIQPADPILVYFSGHGDRQKAPPEWHTSDEHTELIIPHDASSWEEDLDSRRSANYPGGESNASAGEVNSNLTRYDPNKNYNYGIPDRTLGALIHQLSRAKGDNITVILDCCHSASATRGHRRRVRYAHDPKAPPIPYDTDQDFGHSPSQVPPSQKQSMGASAQTYGNFVAPSQTPSLETHVLLTACRNNERAQEIPNVDSTADETAASSSGLFTKALLAALHECDLATTSYSALMRCVQKHAEGILSGLHYEPDEGGVEVQVPQCEGRKQDRLLFRTQLALTKGMIHLYRGPEPNTFMIKAGSASGIQKDTELAVYSGSSISTTSQPIALLAATEVTATEATLCKTHDDPNIEIPEDAYVVVTKYTGHSVRILVDDRLKQFPLWQEVFSMLQSQKIDIIWSKPDEPSDLVLVPTTEGVVLLRQDPSLIQLQPRDIKLDHQLGEKELTRAMSAIVHLHFHLQRRNPNSPLQDKVGMKLVELKAKPGRVWGVKDYVPAKDNPKDLFGGCMSSGTVADLRADPDKRYGLQLTNTSNWPLFAWVLYFDLEDYSIGLLYGPPARNTNPPLSTNGRELAVGYGDAGVEPLRVDASGASNRESGIFMLLVSNTWVDISHIEQASIFEHVANAGVRNDIAAPIKPESNVWDVFMVGVSISK
ncbi:hypothetical protein FRC07_003098 [Ceratobasidium sp. 392]|nr:hypothetical protein FRC07_003098 [Ceratobasidium sp. 392]